MAYVERRSGRMDDEWADERTRPVKELVDQVDDALFHLNWIGEKLSAGAPDADELLVSKQLYESTLDRLLERLPASNLRSAIGRDIDAETAERINAERRKRDRERGER